MIYQLPPNSPVIPCGKCHAASAIGVYSWESKTFSTITEHKAILCAECGLKIADTVKMFTPKDQDDPVFYKPNKNVHLVATFNYGSTSPSPQPVSTPPTPESQVVQRYLPKMAAGALVALARMIHHDENLLNSHHTKGNTRLRWSKKVTCLGCGISFSQINLEKRCPGCGQKNKLERR
jgi:DNA-directed RNA polymerase subunit RPC12/RpoP